MQNDIWWIVSWVVSNTLVAGLLAGLALACDRLWKRPALAHVLWVLVLVKMLTPPMVTLPIAVEMNSFGWLSEYQVSGHGRLADTQDAERLTQIGASFGSTSPRDVAITFADWLIGVWALGGMGLIWWIASCSRRLRLLIKRRGRPDMRVTAQLRQLAGSQRTPPVWMVDAVISPMLVGAGKGSKILFPRTLWQNLDEDARQLLLVHELEHWRRRDPLVRYLEAVAWIVLWWHPLVWVARRQIENCEERCCDLAAARAGSQRRVYAEAILATLDFISEPSRWADLGNRPVASAIGRLPQIEQRLRGIMTASESGRLGKTCRLLLAVVILTLPLHPALILIRV